MFVNTYMYIHTYYIHTYRLYMYIYTYIHTLYIHTYIHTLHTCLCTYIHSYPTIYIHTI